MILAVQDANSKAVEVVAFADVDIVACLYLVSKVVTFSRALNPLGPVVPLAIFSKNLPACNLYVVYVKVL